MVAPSNKKKSISFLIMMKVLFDRFTDEGFGYESV